MDLFSIPCTTCGSKLKVKSLSAIGQIFNCPKCRGMVMVEPPPGWTPPVVEQKSPPPAKAPKRQPAAAAQPRKVAVVTTAFEGPVDDELNVPVATMIDAPWQSPVETRWRRAAMIGVPAATAIAALVISWALWSRPDNGETIVAAEQPAETVAEAPAEPPAEPAKVDVAEAPEPADEFLPLAWLPADTRLVLSLRLAQLAEHETAPEALASGGSPLRQTLADLHATFKLQPADIRRITWAATEKSGIVILELARPLEDDSGLLAGSQPLNVHLQEAVCHQPPAGGWTQPFAIVDASTLVTGPIDALQEIGEAEQGAAMTSGLQSSAESSITLVVDSRHLPADRLQWPTAVDDALASIRDWPVLRDLPQAIRIDLNAAEKTSIEATLLCATAEAAVNVESALQDTLGQGKDTAGDFASQLRRWLADTQVSRDDSTVSCRATWSGDDRLLAAGLLANLPQWKVAPPLEAVAATPAAQSKEADVAPPPAPSEPADRRTPFERQVSRRFEERIPAIVLRGMQLGEFTAFLSRMTGVTIALDEEGLAAQNVDRRTPIEVDLTAATIGEVLTAALSSHQLGYVTQENRLLITTRRQAEAAREGR